MLISLSNLDAMGKLNKVRPVGLININRDLKISDGDVNENVISKYNFALS